MGSHETAYEWGQMGQLTTHILDTRSGIPAAGVDVRLFAIDAERTLRAAATTNSDGRTEYPLLDAEVMQTGEYEIEFDVGAYFKSQGVDSSEPAFLNTVVIRFSIDADEQYHVPLLVSPWSYSTYRGS